MASVVQGRASIRWRGQPTGDFAVVADPDPGLLAPDKRPPGTSEGGTEDGTVLGEGFGAGGVWGGAEFAMDFLLVDVRRELVQQDVGFVQFEDLVGGQQRGQAFLPVVVAAFDFAFGLGA